MKLFFHILLVIISFGSFGQKGKKDSFFNPLENSIDVAISSAKNAYNLGDYEKSKEISQRLSKSINTSGKKQELINLAIASENQLKFRFEAHTALRNGDYKKAVQVYEKMLNANPYDVVAKGAINATKAIINKPKNNAYETALDEAKGLYDSALKGSGLSSQQRIDNLEKARKIWVAIERTSNSTRVGLVQNINSVDDLLSSVRRLATADSKTKQIVANEIKAKYPEANSFISRVLAVGINDEFAAESLFESTYAKGIFALRKCDYQQALGYFEKAHKMRPGAAKTKKYYYDLRAVVALNKQIEDLKRSTNGKSTDILATYDRIKKLNADFELTQSNSSCVKIDEIITGYITSEMPVVANYSSCEEIYLFAKKLNSYIGVSQDDKKITDLVTACDKLKDACTTGNQKIKNRIIEAIQQQNGGFYEASNLELQKAKTEIEKLKIECEEFESLEFLKGIRIIEMGNDNLLSQKSCRGKQQIDFEEGGNLSETQEYEKAIGVYNSIDTSCIDVAFKNKLKTEITRITVMFRRQQMAIFEAKADRSTTLGFYKDANIFLGEAFEFADLDTDAKRISNKLDLNACYQRYQGKPCPPVVNPFVKKNCIDSITLKQTKAQFLIGVNSSTFNSEFLKPTARLLSGIQTGTYNFIPFFGFRLNHQSFIRPIDYNIGLQFTPGTEMSFLSQQNVNSTRLSLNSLDFDTSLKFHRLHDCRDKGRAYFFLGANAGYKNLRRFTSPSTPQQEYVSANYSNFFLVGYQSGFGYEFPKDRLSLEIEYKRQGMVYNKEVNLINPFNRSNSQFLIGYLALKVGYSF